MAGRSLPLSFDFVLEDPTAGNPIPSCPTGCGGLQATANASGGLDIGYTNLTGHILSTAALSYTIERSVDDQWGIVFGPAPVPTATLTLYPGQTLTWSWQATDNQAGDAPEGEYRAVLLGTGSAAASGSEDGGVTPGTQTRTRTNYYLDYHTQLMPVAAPKTARYRTAQYRVAQYRVAQYRASARFDS